MAGEEVDQGRLVLGDGGVILDKILAVGIAGDDGGADLFVAAHRGLVEIDHRQGLGDPFRGQELVAGDMGEVDHRKGGEQGGGEFLDIGEFHRQVVLGQVQGGVPGENAVDLEPDQQADQMRIAFDDPVFVVLDGEVGVFALEGEEDVFPLEAGHVQGDLVHGHALPGDGVDVFHLAFLFMVEGEEFAPQDRDVVFGDGQPGLFTLEAPEVPAQAFVSVDEIVMDPDA